MNPSLNWSRSKRINALVKSIWVYGGLLFFLVTMLFPFYWMLITSITPDAVMYNIDRNPLIVLEPTIEHYVKLIQDSPFLLWLKNSLQVALVSTSISLVVGTLAAYSLARLRFRGGQTMGMMIFVTYLVPTSLLFLPLAYVVRSLGMFDKPIALMVTYPTVLIPFCTWLLMGYFKGIPRELEECAMVDGCTRFGAFVRIVLPISLPGLVSAGLFAFTLSWNEFIYALTLAQSNSVKTFPIGVVSQVVLGDVYFWGQYMAAPLLGSVPIAILYSFFLEYYVKGMTAGAVKG